jgi:hypothetical protein
MPLPNILKPFAAYWTDEPKPAGSARKAPPLTEEERRRKEVSDYLVSLSRNSARGKAYNDNANALRAMVGRAKATNDPYERNAIINAMRNKGMLVDE